MTAPSPDLIVHSTQPFNAEPDLVTLRSTFVTAQADFYVRSHGDVPVIDAAAHRIAITGRVASALSLSVADLRERFAEHTIEAVMQCAGNRRADLQKVRQVSGDPWGPGAIGNARWNGVALSDVLRHAGAETDATHHVAFSSLDECDVDGAHFRYGASIPMTKAMSPEVLLAYAMNGEPLAPEHGYPIRVVVPGFAGVRSPKWLASIEVRDTPSDNPIQDLDYKLLPPDIVSSEAIDWSRGFTINDLPVTSAICEPAPHARLKVGAVTMRGYAIATARPIARVDVSTDSGRTWMQAALDESGTNLWSWIFWSAAVELTIGEHELVVRAWDTAGQTQPSQPDDTWNIKGYLSTAWHRIAVTAR